MKRSSTTTVFDTGIGLQSRIRSLLTHFILNLPLQTSNEEDTSYSAVSDKEKEDPQNGTYIGLTAKSEPQE